GMGCGKSVVAHIFSSLGVAVYDADSRAKEISALPSTRAAIAALFGEEASRNRKVLAEKVFAKPEELAKLNALLHPLVMEDCRKWFEDLASRKDYTAPYAVAEAAILFESGMEKLFDYIVTVEAPQEVQIARAMKRDGSTREQVLARLSRQLPSEVRRQKADAVLLNDSLHPILPDVLNLNRKFCIN
ncbi:MAG: dephospho-CoA kinase, partial [Bacteroidales bacterium]|nr:dephospho-CoA kinase [Bacteroidales bacterium]